VKILFGNLREHDLKLGRFREEDEETGKKKKEFNT